MDALAALRFQDTFNPYSDACAEHDGGEAPQIRRRNMRLVLEAAVSRGVCSIWVARDLGYRGGRRTGLPLTDEAHLPEHAGLFGGFRLPKPRVDRSCPRGQRRWCGERFARSRDPCSSGTSFLSIPTSRATPSQIVDTRVPSARLLPLASLARPISAALDCRRDRPGCCRCPREG